MIFVTGGTGFLGRNLIPYLAARGHRLRVLTRNPEAHPWLQAFGAEPVQGDLDQPDHLQTLLEGCDAVIHAGGLFRMWGDPEDFQRTNVHGTQTIAAAALEAGVSRFVHVSTIAVIGNPQPGQVIDETHPPCPADPYQRSKLAGEAVILQHVAEHGLPAVILRPGAFYGPHGHYAFNRLFFEDPLKGLLIKVSGGRHVIFPAYIEDVAAAIVLALEHGRVGEIYNICGESITHNEANAIVSEEAGLPRARINAPKSAMILLALLWTWLSHYTHAEPYYPINLRSYVFNDWPVSSNKARDELGFRPTSFREGARRTLAWYRSLDDPAPPPARLV